MPISRFTNQIYIERSSVENTIKEKIDNKISKVIFIDGVGGAGKSTLLKRILSYSNDKKFLLS